MPLQINAVALKVAKFGFLLNFFLAYAFGAQ